MRGARSFDEPRKAFLFLGTIAQRVRRMFPQLPRLRLSASNSLFQMKLVIAEPPVKRLSAPGVTGKSEEPSRGDFGSGDKAIIVWLAHFSRQPLIGFLGVLADEYFFVRIPFQR